MNSATKLTGVIRRLRTRSGDVPADGELIAQYVRESDEGAFATLVERYGGLVLGVARRQLADHQQAEDVFQATFLALARSANKLNAKTTLTNWLYTVALRQARILRARSYRRGDLEQSAPSFRATEIDPLATVSGRELVQIIDDELARLPDKYRLPVLLCYMQGLSRDEVAQHLRWSGGAVKGRLERGRQRLARRLAARGLAPSMVLFAPLASVVVPSELLARTCVDALTPWSTAIAPQVAALAASSGSRWIVAFTTIACSLLATSLIGWAIVSIGQAPKDPTPAAPGRPAETAPVAANTDPLPEDATLRFGTSRYRQGTAIAGLTVSSDGKRAAVTSAGHVHGAVRGFDMTDGRILFTLPTLSFDAEAVALSPDGQTLAVKASNAINLYDAATGKELRKISLADTGGGTLTEWIKWTPDGKSVALTQGNSHGVVLVDVEKGQVARTFPHGNVVYAVAFSPDGKHMAAGGYDSDKNGYFTRLWEVATGKELRRLTHSDGGLRTVAFSPDGKTVAAGGDSGWARVWDVESGKELKKLPKAGYRVRSVAFAPDGQTLAVAGDAIRVFDLKTFELRLRIDRKAMGLHFSPDSKILTGGVTGAIHQWDTATGKPLTPQSAGESAIDQVLATRDGRRLVTRGQDGDAHLWNAKTGDHLRTIAATWQRGIAMSPDGQFLVWPVEDEKVKFKDPARPNAIHTGCRLRLYDLTADKFIERFPGFEGDAQELFFTPDGRTVITVDHRDGMTRLWDFATGKEQRKFEVIRAGEKAQNYFVWNAVLSPDGKTLAVTYQPHGFGILAPFAVRLWNVAAGTEKSELNGHYYYVNMAFSPDSRLVVTCSQALEKFAQEHLKQAANQIFVWDTATGKRLTTLPDGLPAGAVVAAFADDGHTLATATPDGLIQMWETATWTIRSEHRGHRDRVNSLTFAADGRLFTGGLDTTVLAWDIRPPKVVGSIDAAWESLLKPESAVAFKAQGHLLASPAEAVKLIASKLKPAESPDPKRLTALVADLDSATFATREKASKELLEIGRPALAALREIARTSKSSEVGKRATDLIEQIDGPTVSSKELRELRAIDVLVWIGTGDAKELLAKLAKGEANARLTIAAAAAIRQFSNGQK
ncbi:MAG TPA: sigma-70 family RNA polymerase sigma factor [Gemmataceae bacterium]|jgi:RNA polymerase sigma factor (sigma-70 family)|nr:sigma-70 family RNA polymerase sigma factor [Gemmataceae bacterium]